MMDAFNYLTVLLSIIMGLAMTQILKGFRGILLSRSRIRLYWPSLVWALLMLTICVEIWWSQYGMRERVDWTLPAFYAVLLQFLIAYMLAAIVLPDFFGPDEIDLHEHYSAHVKWFFGLMVALLLSSVLKEYVLNGHFPDTSNLVFHVVFIATSAVAMFVRNDTFHKIASIVAVVLFAMYTMLLFWHLH
jgi:FtsH-binding integral membrane protein